MLLLLHLHFMLLELPSLFQSVGPFMSPVLMDKEDMYRHRGTTQLLLQALLLLSLLQPQLLMTTTTTTTTFTTTTTTIAASSIIRVSQLRAFAPSVMVLLLRPVWITFQCYNFSVVAVFAVIYSKMVVNGQLSLLKSYPNCP